MSQEEQNVIQDFLAQAENSASQGNWETAAKYLRPACRAARIRIGSHQQRAGRFIVQARHAEHIRPRR